MTCMQCASWQLGKSPDHAKREAKAPCQKRERPNQKNAVVFHKDRERCAQFMLASPVQIERREDYLRRAGN